MRIFFISDIHGHYDSFLKLLDYVSIDLNHDHLIIGGDMINRGPKSAQVLQWAQKNVNNHPKNVHVLAGNHEEMMIWYMNNVSPMWMQFGGGETIRSFKRVYGHENGWMEAEYFSKWLETLPLVYEDENAIYTHAGVDIYTAKEQQAREILWKSTKEVMSLNQMKLKNWSNGKKIFRGHNPSPIVHQTGPFVNCDLGCGVFDEEDAALALVDVIEKRYYRCLMSSEITAHEIDK